MKLLVVHLQVGKHINSRLKEISTFTRAADNFKTVSLRRVFSDTFESVFCRSTDFLRTDDLAFIVIKFEKNISGLFFLRNHALFDKCGKHIIVKSSGLAQIRKHTPAIISFGKGKLPCRNCLGLLLIGAGRIICQVIVFTVEGFNGFDKGHSHELTEKSDIVTAFARTEPMPYSTFALDIIFNMQAVVFLPYILLADLFQIEAVRHEELRKIDVCRPFFLFIIDPH